jgi:hypothetical protein
MGGKKKIGVTSASLGKTLIKSKQSKKYMVGEGPGGLGYKVVSNLLDNLFLAHNNGNY